VQVVCRCELSCAPAAVVRRSTRCPGSVYITPLAPAGYFVTDPQLRGVADYETWMCGAGVGGGGALGHAGGGRGGRGGRTGHRARDGEVEVPSAAPGAEGRTRPLQAAPGWRRLQDGGELRGGAQLGGAGGVGEEVGGEGEGGGAAGGLLLGQDPGRGAGGGG